MSILSDEIQNDPLGLGYSQWLPDSPGTVLNLLNAQNYLKVKFKMMAELDVIGEYPLGPIEGDALLTKLETFSLTSDPMASLVKRALKVLSQAEGLNVGSSAIQAMLTQLEIEQVITSQEASNLKSLAEQPASRAEILGLSNITIEQIIEVGI